MPKLLQNRYQINQALNRGGMSMIYSALDTRLQNTVVVKELDTDEFPNQTENMKEVMKEAFQREAEILGSLNHPSIPKAIDYFTENNSQYLVIELVTGVSLEKIITKHGKDLTQKQIFDWFYQLLDVTEYLHSLKNPIVHRDIKPANIKINQNGRLYMLDFGISKILGEEYSAINKTLHFATLEFAPLEQAIQASTQIKNSLLAINTEKTEQFMKEKTSFQTDIFSLGATLYRLLTGQLPMDAHARALSVWSGKPDTLRTTPFPNHKIPAALVSVIMESLSLFPSLRPRSVSTFKDAIMTALNNDISLLPHTEESKPRIAKQDSSVYSKKSVHFNSFLRNYESLKEKCLKQEKELSDMRESQRWSVKTDLFSNFLPDKRSFQSV